MNSVPANPGPANAGPISVMLVDDHAIVRQGVKTIIEREGDIVVVAEAATRQEALKKAAEVDAAVVVVDLKLSASEELEGLTLCEQLSELLPDAAVLILTTFLDRRLVHRAIAAGARGYVVKDVDTTALVNGIRSLHGGGSVFDSSSAAEIVRGLQEPALTIELTERERQVLAEMANGLSNRAIGQALYISEYTAKFHVANIIRKFGVQGRTEAVYVATQRGYL